MPCYHPMVGTPCGFTSSGKPDYKLSSFRGKAYMLPGDVLIPCGQCIGCRLDYSRAWADRMMLELDHSKVAFFLTLTYNDDFVHPSMFNDDGFPVSFTLNKRDVQLFMKRLRSYFPDKEIRYFLAGEYGDRTHRPHYHAIIFGLSLDDFRSYGSLELLSINQNGTAYFKSDWLSECVWKLGFCLLTECSWQTCAYTARYVTKKAKGLTKDFYAAANLVPEFALMSRRPGIGLYFPREHPDCYDHKSVRISDLSGCRRVENVYLPKRVIKMLEKDNPELYNKLVTERRTFAEDKQLLVLSQTDLDDFEQLGVSEYYKNQSLSSLRRFL